MPNDTFAGNRFGVKVNPINFAHQYAPTIKTYHGFTVALNDNVVGRVLSWNPSQNYAREHQLVYELNKDTWGLPVDLVPGRATGFQVSFVRMEVWEQELERIIQGSSGANIWNNLMDQNAPFTIDEFFYRGDQLYLQFQYIGCWITQKNEDAYSADGDAIIRCNCEVAYVRRRLVGGGGR